MIAGGAGAAEPRVSPAPPASPPPGTDRAPAPNRLAPNLLAPNRSKRDAPEVTDRA